MGVFDLREGSKILVGEESADQLFEEMSELKRALEWLRPLVLGSNIWDYCVLWKLGDDPSRFIELVGCCCNGSGGKSQNQQVGMKRRKKATIPICRDVSSVHPANTKACQALAALPSSMPLYSGIHGEVVISSHLRWLNIAKTSNSNTSTEENFETQVLIPVIGGLVELFSAKLILEDERIIEFVKAQFNICSEIEAMSTTAISFNGHSIDPILDQSTTSCLSSLKQPTLLPFTQSLIPISQNYSHPILDGSSTGSFPTDERPSPDSNPCSVSQSTPLKPCSGSQEDYGIAKDRMVIRLRPDKKYYQSRNLVSERKRRSRIHDGFLTLRSLVPKITKMDKASTLGDSINYIKELENQIKELQDELQDVGKVDCNKKASKERDIASYNRERLKSQVQVQVSKLGAGQFLVRMKCQQMPGAFTELLEGLGSLGLNINDVKDANVTTCNGTLLSILTIQTNKKEIQAKDLRDSLTRLTA